MEQIRQVLRKGNIRECQAGFGRNGARGISCDWLSHFYIDSVRKRERAGIMGKRDTCPFCCGRRMVIVCRTQAEYGEIPASFFDNLKLQIVKGNLFNKAVLGKAGFGYPLKF